MTIQLTIYELAFPRNTETYKCSPRFEQIIAKPAHFCMPFNFHIFYRN